MRRGDTPALQLEARVIESSDAGDGGFPTFPRVWRWALPYMRDHSKAGCYCRHEDDSSLKSLPAAAASRLRPLVSVLLTVADAFISTPQTS